MWLAFNAPHAPFHLPPVALHDFDYLAGEEVPSYLASAEELLPWFQASAQAMDSELGRLLQWLDEHGQGDVDVIFLGDNGTPPEVVQAPLDRTRGKGTVFQGGVQVPLCIRGPSVAQPGRVEPRPVATVDILSTVLDLAGVPADELPGADEVYSQSLGPVLRDPEAELPRDWTFVEGYAELSRYGSTHALVQDGLKLVRYEDYDEVELYDLASDPLERVDLLGQPTFDERRDAELEAASDDKGRPGNDHDDDDDDDDHDDHDDDPEWAEATADLSSLLDALLGSGR